MFESLLERGGLSLDRLRNFLAVADAGSIAKAAARDANRQSLISRQIRELEAFFGVELTARRGKGIVVTGEGRRLAALVRTQLLGLEDFLADARGAERIFTVGAGGSIIEWLVAPAASGIRGALGGASLRLEVQRSADLVGRVREGRLDFAVVRQTALPPGAKKLPVAEIGYSLCVPKTLLGKGGAIPRDIGQLPLALPVPGGNFHASLSGHFEAAGIAWRPAVACSSFLQSLALVRTGEFAAFLPEVAEAGLPERDFITRKMAALKPLKRKLVLHWNERQMATRDVAGAAIRSVRDALKGAV